MIQGVEWLWRVDCSKVNNLVLINLFCMGILDWMGPNDHLHQVTQAIQHSTALHLGTFSCIMTLGHRVRNQLYDCCVHTN